MSLETTPLTADHRRLGARMVEFGGWDMPVQYAGIIQEHEAVRRGVGVFDVSHMGEFLVEGPGALELLQRTTPNDVAKLVPGRAHYSSLLTDEGTFVDDILVYRLANDRFMVVVNASNALKDFAWLEAAHAALARSLPGPVSLANHSEKISLIAVQGPAAERLVSSIYRGVEPTAPAAVKYYGFVQGGTFAGQPIRVLSRTGYTGEDGFELYVDAEHALPVWRAILDAGATPCGLGARDTLRLEAGMCLYGNDIDDTTTPIEAGLQWTVKPEKGDFTGREVLVRQLADGPRCRLVGLEITDRGIARQGHAVVAGGESVGIVTSGTHSPTLGRAIAMAYVPPSFETGMTLEVDVRGKALAARVVDLPFYSRKRQA